MLDKMPKLEVYSIDVIDWSKQFFDTVSQKPIFRTKQNLLKVLDFGVEDAPDQSEPYDYLKIVWYPEEHDMSRYVKQTEQINIDKFDKNMNIDCLTERITINPDSIQDLNNFILGSQEFKNSVSTIIVLYSS